MAKEKESEGKSSFDEYHFQERCLDLKKQLDSYIQKVEGMKKVEGHERKEIVLQKLRTLSVCFRLVSSYAIQNSGLI